MSSHADDIVRRGYAVLDAHASDDLLPAMRTEFEHVLGMRQRVMERNGITDGTMGTAHHVLERDSPLTHWLVDLSASEAIDLAAALLEGKVVLNSIGAVDNSVAAGQYVAKVHRDVRSFTRGAPLMAQMLVALDDFTAENGATWVMPASHLEAQRPDDSVFFACAEQVCPRAGQLVLFDSRLWHAAGVNRTGRPRRALTLTFTRTFMKPQFDYCRYLGPEYVETLPDSAQQLLGYLSRVPSTLEEWYLPRERRFYRPDQD